MTFVAVIDPAWDADQGGGGRGAQNHYALDGVDGLAQGYLMHEAWMLGGPALVFMWATAGAMAQKDHRNPPDAYALAHRLGLRVCASLVWCKIDEVKLGKPSAGVAYRPPARMGLGQWTRCEDERLLICRRGDVPVPAPECRPRSVIYAPRGAHSEKPEEAWVAIEMIAGSSMPGVVGVEFNARVQRPGWAAVGRLGGEDGAIVFRGAA